MPATKTLRPTPTGEFSLPGPFAAARTGTEQTSEPSAVRYTFRLAALSALSTTATYSVPSAGPKNVGVDPLPQLSRPGLRAEPRSYALRQRIFGAPSREPRR